MPRSKAHTTALVDEGAAPPVTGSFSGGSGSGSGKGGGVPGKPLATTAGKILVFPHTMSDGLTRTDDDNAVNVPSLFFVTNAMLEMLERSSSETGIHTSTVPLRA